MSEEKPKKADVVLFSLNGGNTPPDMDVDEQLVSLNNLHKINIVHRLLLFPEKFEINHRVPERTLGNLAWRKW